MRKGYFNGKLLLVENDSAAAEYLTELLRNSGFCVCAVRNEIGAAQILKKQDFDMVLLDISLTKVGSVFECGDIRVDANKGLVTKRGKEIFLSALEYRILLIFLQNKGKILSRRRLLDEIWDIGGEYVSDNTLTVYIKRIREKIENEPKSPQIIKTVRGVGYKLGE